MIKFLSSSKSRTASFMTLAIFLNAHSKAVLNVVSPVHGAAVGAISMHCELLCRHFKLLALLVGQNSGSLFPRLVSLMAVDRSIPANDG